jgi:hypothetical protein
MRVVCLSFGDKLKKKVAELEGTFESYQTKYQGSFWDDLRTEIVSSVSVTLLIALNSRLHSRHQYPMLLWIYQHFKKQFQILALFERKIHSNLPNAVRDSSIYPLIDS